MRSCIHAVADIILVDDPIPWHAIRTFNLPCCSCYARDEIHLREKSLSELHRIHVRESRSVSNSMYAFADRDAASGDNSKD